MAAARQIRDLGLELLNVRDPFSRWIGIFQQTLHIASSVLLISKLQEACTVSSQTLEQLLDRIEFAVELEQHNDRKAEQSQQTCEGRMEDLLLCLKQLDESMPESLSPRLRSYMLTTSTLTSIKAHVKLAAGCLPKPSIMTARDLVSLCSLLLSAGFPSLESVLAPALAFRRSSSVVGTTAGMQQCEDAWNTVSAARPWLSALADPNYVLVIPAPPPPPAASPYARVDTALARIPALPGGPLQQVRVYGAAAVPGLYEVASSHDMDTLAYGLRPELAHPVPADGRGGAPGPGQEFFLVRINARNPIGIL